MWQEPVPVTPRFRRSDSLLEQRFFTPILPILGVIVSYDILDTLGILSKIIRILSSFADRNDTHIGVFFVLQLVEK